MIKEAYLHLKYYWTDSREKKIAIGHFNYYDLLKSENSRNITSLIHSAYYMRLYASKAQILYTLMKQGKKDQELSEIVDEANITLRFYDDCIKNKKIRKV